MGGTLSTKRRYQSPTKGRDAVVSGAGGFSSLAPTILARRRSPQWLPPPAETCRGVFPRLRLGCGIAEGLPWLAAFCKAGRLVSSEVEDLRRYLISFQDRHVRPLRHPSIPCLPRPGALTMVPGDRIGILRSLYSLHASHILSESHRHDNRSIRLLIVLQDGDQSSSDGEPGSVQRVDKLCFRIFFQR